MGKAQIRMGETISVLVIFFFLVFIGFSFYANIQQKQIAQQQREAQQLLSIQMAQKVYYLPELQCSRGYQLVRESCWDTQKVEKLADILLDAEAKQYYFDVFGYSTINITQIYPSSAFLTLILGQTEYSLYDNPLTGTGDKAVSSRRTNMPIALYDPIEKQYAFAVVEVDYYYFS